MQAGGGSPQAVAAARALGGRLMDWRPHAALAANLTSSLPAGLAQNLQVMFCPDQASADSYLTPNSVFVCITTSHVTIPQSTTGHPTRVVTVTVKTFRACTPRRCAAACSRGSNRLWMARRCAAALAGCLCLGEAQLQRHRQHSTRQALAVCRTQQRTPAGTLGRWSGRSLLLTAAAAS